MMIDIPFIISQLHRLTDEELEVLEEEIVHWRGVKAGLISNSIFKKKEETE